MSALAIGGALFASPPPAAAATVTAGEATAVQGQSQVALPLSVVVASGEQLTAVYLDVQFDPAAVVWQAAELDPTVAALGKSLEANLVAAGHLRVVIYGQDRQALASGTLASLLLQVPASALPGSTLISLVGGEASDPNGQALNLGLTDGRLWIDAAPVLVDVTAPQLLVTTPTDGASFTEGDPVPVAGTAVEEASNPVVVTVNGSAVTVGLDDHFSTTLIGLAAGSHLVTVTAIDTAGNPTTVQRTVTIEPKVVLPPSPTAPTVTILSPTQGSAVSDNRLDLAFAVDNATLKVGSTHLHVQVDDGSTWHVYSTDVLHPTVADGAHTVSIQLVDGNHAPLTNPEASAAATFTVGSVVLPPPPSPTDTTPPVLSLSSPAEGAVFVEGADVPVVGVATDADSTPVTVQVDGSAVAVAADGSFSTTLTGLAVGSYTGTVTATDAAGNTAIVQRTITIEAQAPAPDPTPPPVIGPVVTILEPANGSTVSGPRITLAFDVDGIKISTRDAHLHVQMDDGSTWHVYSLKPLRPKLSTGTHHVTIQIVDGNHQPISGSGTFAESTFTVR